MTEADRSFVIRAFVIALIFWGSAVVIALLRGLWSPTVDNKEIFSILGPISQNVSSAAISIVSALIGYKVGESKGNPQ